MIGRFEIHDDHPHAPTLDIPQIIILSSNIAAARIADAMGAERMQAAFRSLGFDRAPQIELAERTRPLWPRDWARATVMTSGFGHGIAITPLHLATAYCALVNGGIWRPATLLRVEPGHAVRAAASSQRRPATASASCCASSSLQGTGRNADVAGLPRRRQDRHRREGDAPAAIIVIRTFPPSRRLSRWTRRAMWCSS